MNQMVNSRKNISNYIGLLLVFLVAAIFVLGTSTAASSTVVSQSSQSSPALAIHPVPFPPPKYPGVLAGERKFVSSSVLKGKVYYFGGWEGNLVWSQLGEQSYDGSGTAFGSAVDELPDVTGDSIPEIVVGARQYSPSASNLFSGKIYVYDWSTAGGVLLWSKEGEGNGYQNFGVVLKGAPDVSGDSVPDVLVGAKNSSNQTFKLYALSGVDGATIWSRVYASPQDRFIESIRDITGDGIADFLMTNYVFVSGKFYGSLGAYSGVDGSAVWTVQMPNPSPAINNSSSMINEMGSIADVDNDGLDDIIVGVPEIDYAGRVLLLSGADGSVVWSQAGVAQGSGNVYQDFGYSVSSVPDLSGDGFSDVVVGAPNDSAGSPCMGIGRYYVLSGVDGTNLWEKPGVYLPQSGDTCGIAAFFGNSVRGVKDVDKDGKGDIAVGAPGAGSPLLPDHSFIFMYSSGTQEELWSYSSGQLIQGGGIGDYAGLSGMPST